MNLKNKRSQFIVLNCLSIIALLISSIIYADVYFYPRYCYMIFTKILLISDPLLLAAAIVLRLLKYNNHLLIVRLNSLLPIVSVITVTFFIPFFYRATNSDLISGAVGSLVLAIATLVSTIASLKQIDKISNI